MYNPSARTERCTILRNAGDFCDLESIDDTPFPICAKHAVKLYRHLADLSEDDLAAMAPRAKTAPPESQHLRKQRNDAIRLLQAGESVVYAVRFPDGIIKIGCTTDLPQRLSTVCKGGGHLVGFMPGDYVLEQEIHGTLREHRHHGREWYHAVPAVIAIVNEMRDGFDMPHLAA